MVTVQMIAVRSSSIFAPIGSPCAICGFFSKISQKMALFENTFPISPKRFSDIRNWPSSTTFSPVSRDRSGECLSGMFERRGCRGKWAGRWPGMRAGGLWHT